MPHIKCIKVKKPPKPVIEHVLETTLAIIKPDGMPYRNEILRIILKEGYQILQQRMVRLTPEQASDFYKSKQDLKTYNLMVLSLAEGPIEVMCLGKDNCIEDWKCLMGPERTSDAVLCYPDTIRGMFGTCSDDQRNVVHGSENERFAKNEIHYFFPNFIIEPIQEEDAKKLCCETVLMGTLFDGLNKVSTERPLDPVTWLAQWLLHNNPLKPVISDTCDESQSKIKDLEAMAAATGSKFQQFNQKLHGRRSLSSMSSSVTCLCSCQAASSFDSSARSVHDQYCSCRMVLKPEDTTFCPVCHKTMKFQIKPMSFRQPPDESSSSHVCTGPSSSSSTSQMESSSCITIPPI